MLSLFPFSIIHDWYQTNGRHHLPWRADHEPYKVWISEIFLQQTQVTRVEKYFTKVVSDFPKLEDFAKLEYEEFFPYYEGLGYYSRARNMLKTAKLVMDVYQGVFPHDVLKLRSLPGIGPYTAQAILAFGYDEPVLAFDTNIEKVFARYYFGSRLLKLTSSQKDELQAQFRLSGFSGREINAGLMDFANLVDFNEKDKVDFSQYPLTQSIFFKEQGRGEVSTQKSTCKFDKKSSTIIVFLHQDHKIYYSRDVDTYHPFLLSPSSLDHRTVIKAYFLKEYGLSLSVRPAFLKTKDSFYYHAQIQTGSGSFGEFGKEEYKNTLDKVKNETF